MKIHLPERNRFSLKSDMSPLKLDFFPSTEKRHSLKKKICSLASAVAAMGVMAGSSVSCTLETSDNGDLDGFWHLERVDTLATGGVCDLSEELRFWAVQRHLISIVDHGNSSNGGYFGYLSHFSHEGDRMRLYDMYVNDRMVGDIKMETAEPLNVFGINALEENFRVEQLSSSRMQLSTDVLRLHFRKM